MVPDNCPPVTLSGYGDTNDVRPNCIDVVDKGLADLGLVVEPHFTALQLDDLVTVSSAVDSEPEPDQGAQGSASMAASPKLVNDDETRTDLAWRVGSLALVRKVVTVQAQQPIGVALERMVAGEYSQLPMVDSFGRLKGVITWESIAHAQFTRVSHFRGLGPGAG